MGNRLQGSASRGRAPRWARLLAYAVGVALVFLTFYLAIRWSMDVGYGDGEG